MDIDGVWGFVYWGEAGLGIGAFVIRDGKVHGSDSTVKYTGTVTEDTDTGEVSIDLTMDIPPGVWLAGGAGASEFQTRRTQTLKFPPRFGDLTPIEVPIRPGKTMAVFKPYSDDWARYANGFTIVPKA